MAKRNSDTGGVWSRRQMLAATGAASVAMAVPVAAAAGAVERVTLVRNATLRLDYAGVRFLVDPMLADQGAYPGFRGSAMSHLRNPLTPLPLPVDALLDVDAVIVTQTHLDHWDAVARERLPKTLPVFAQNEGDANAIRGQGFSDVRVMTGETVFNGVQLARTGGHHGADEVVQAVAGLDPVSGVVLRHPSRKTIYVAGDTVWNAEVASAIEAYRPDTIILNAGYAQFVDVGPILMGPQDVFSVHRAAPQALLIAVHMEALNHCILSRADLRAFSETHGFAASLLIPSDGEQVPV